MSADPTMKVTVLPTPTCFTGTYQQKGIVRRGERERRGKGSKK